jgi:hypothetical protein
MARLEPWPSEPGGLSTRVLADSLFAAQIRNAETNKLIASGFHSKVNVMPKATKPAAKL